MLLALALPLVIGTPAWSQTTSKEAGAGDSKQIEDLQNRIRADPQMSDTINALQSDPEVQSVLEDPEVARAIESGNTEALLANPKIQELVNHPKIQEITKKLAQ
ncbi:MAG TPA: hypothetical protein VL403_14875 [Candidatus Kryptonia bacterium]|nr:hypothetical protein [Candidatus Kryptonia bacterium]